MMINILLAYYAVTNVLLLIEAIAAGDGMAIGLPPVVQFGPEWMKAKVSSNIQHVAISIILVIATCR